MTRQQQMILVATSQERVEDVGDPKRCLLMQVFQLLPAHPGVLLPLLLLAVPSPNPNNDIAAPVNP